MFVVANISLCIKYSICLEKFEIVLLEVFIHIETSACLSMFILRLICMCMFEIVWMQCGNVFACVSVCLFVWGCVRASVSMYVCMYVCVCERERESSKQVYVTLLKSLRSSGFVNKWLLSLCGLGSGRVY